MKSAIGVFNAYDARGERPGTIDAGAGNMIPNITIG
jgi:hypothetical protein